MAVVDIEYAETHFLELVERLAVEEEVVIMRAGQPIAKLIGHVPQHQQLRQPGAMKGTVTYMAPDFDAPLDDFKEYMP